MMGHQCIVVIQLLPMLKYFLVFALVFGLAIFVAVQDQRPAQQPAQETQKHGDSASSAAANADHAEQNIRNSEGNQPRWLVFLCYFFRWPNGTTAWGIILTLLAIAEQTSATSRAAQATEDMTTPAVNSASAALLNAQAVVNSERPWLFIHFNMGQLRVDEKLETNSFYLTVSFKNWGKTPAEIIHFEQHPDCVDNTDDLPFPPEYEMEGHVWVHTRILPSGETWHNPGESYFSSLHNLLPDQWEDIKASRKRFVYWGRLRYRDLIEQPTSIHELRGKELGTVHETCFCYFWSPSLNDMLICGRWGYNKHT